MPWPVRGDAWLCIGAARRCRKVKSQPFTIMPPCDRHWPRSNTPPMLRFIRMRKRDRSPDARTKPYASPSPAAHDPDHRRCLACRTVPVIPRPVHAWMTRDASHFVLMTKSRPIVRKALWPRVCIRPFNAYWVSLHKTGKSTILPDFHVAPKFILEGKFDRAGYIRLVDLDNLSQPIRVGEKHHPIRVCPTRET